MAAEIPTPRARARAGRLRLVGFVADAKREFTGMDAFHAIGGCRVLSAHGVRTLLVQLAKDGYLTRVRYNSSIWRPNLDATRRLTDEASRRAWLDQAEARRG